MLVAGGDEIPRFAQDDRSRAGLEARGPARHLIAAARQCGAASASTRISSVSLAFSAMNAAEVLMV